MAMYSLYRAWLMRDAVAAASMTSPPDLLILVGTTNHHFLTHRHLVSLHSGYLKSLLHGATTTISVPNIMPDTFAPLLAFMYTGYLDLNQENVYAVLLATHLLHMPRALELCREFLVRSEAFAVQGANIVKPIPSRKIFHYPQPMWPPVSVPAPLLLPSADGPFRSVLPTEKPEPMPSTSKIETTEDHSPSPSRTPNSLDSDEITVHINRSSKRGKKVNDENQKAVLDVACCDGPVQFHRVLNESYGQTDEQGPIEEGDTTDKKFSNFMHQQMLSSNLYKKSRTAKGVIQLRKIVEKEVESTENDIYTCIHCNHTFKSHFCYEKHVRRHINHVEKIEPKEPKSGVRREVRLLDMNVQYYPCKTCGSKFPSYYFVHKHRKMCHAEENNAQSEQMENN